MELTIHPIIHSSFHIFQEQNFKKSLGKGITKAEIFCGISFIELGEKRLKILYHHQKKRATILNRNFELKINLNKN